MTDKISPIDIFHKLYSYGLPFNVNEELKVEYFKFIALKIYTEDKKGDILSPPSEVDDVWHNHLLYNYHYIDMCSTVNFLIFHWPERDNDDICDKIMRREKFFELSKLHFDSLNKKTEQKTCDYENYSVNKDELSQNTNSTIFIKTLTNNTIIIDVDLENDTLDCLKKRVFLKAGIHPHFQGCVYLGKSMRDNKQKLKDYTIIENSVIYLNFTAKGC
jgi:hypothetical protein